MTDMMKIGVHLPMDAYPIVRDSARAQGLAVSAWVRRLALDAVGYDPTIKRDRIRMEGIAGEPSLKVTLEDWVTDLHRRGYGAQGIAAQTRAPYRRVCEIINQIKAAKAVGETA